MPEVFLTTFLMATNTFQPPFPVVWDTLENGLKIAVAQRKALPIFQVHMAIKAGSIFDPKGKEGTANLVARLLDKGSEDLSAFDIAERIEGIGGSIRVSAQRYTTSVSMRVLTQVADSGLEVLKEVLLKPTFPEEFLKKEIRRVITDIAEDKSDPNAVLNNTFRKEVYPNHPLGIPVEGTEASIANITREDILTFYRNFYLPNNAICAVVSNLPPEEALLKIKDALNRWEKRPISLPVLSEPEPRESKKVIVVDMDVNQAFITLGNLGVKRSNPDYVPLRVFNYILGGGGFVSRLMKEVRTRLGYAYDAYSYFEPGLYFKGLYEVGTETKTENASDAIKEILKILKETVKNGIEENELDETKSYYLGSIPRQTETYGQVASALVNTALYGLPDFYWLKEVQRIQELTLEEVNSTARKYINPEDWVMVIVAKRDSLRLEIPGIKEEQIEYRKVE